MGNGGGIITRKLLFAVLLVASLSLAGISAASAVDVGDAQTYTGNHHTVQKNIKTQIEDFKSVKKPTKTQKNVGKAIKTVKKTESGKYITTLNLNTSKLNTKNANSAAKQRITQKYVPKYAYGTLERFSYKKYGVYGHYRYYGKWKYKKYKVYKQYKYYGKWRYKTIHKYNKVRVANRHYSANSSNISSLARSLTNGVHSQYQKGSRIFNWVKTNLRYSFYYNTRYGASGALKYRTGNCADTANLIVSLARSSGIQARYVSADARFRSGHTYGHVWAQIKVSGKWYTADATSKRNSLGAARNWTSARIKGVYSRLPF